MSEKRVNRISFTRFYFLKTNTMNQREVSIGKIGLVYGFFTFITLVIYFMIMRAFGITGSEIAWGVNFIFLFAGILFALKDYQGKTELNIAYLPGMLLGLTTSAISVISFAVFVWIYFTSSDPNLILALKDNILFLGEEITPTRAAGATLIEGICSGLIISFTVMQYYKAGFKLPFKEWKSKDNSSIGLTTKKPLI